MPPTQCPTPTNLAVDGTPSSDEITWIWDPADGVTPEVPRFNCQIKRPDNSVGNYYAAGNPVVYPFFNATGCESDSTYELRVRLESMNFSLDPQTQEIIWTHETPSEWTDWVPATTAP